MRLLSTRGATILGIIQLFMVFLMVRPLTIASGLIFLPNPNLIESRTYVTGNNTIFRGGEQHIIVVVVDADSSRTIAGANVSAAILNSTNFKQALGSGITNSFGMYEYVYTIGRSTTPGIYSVIANVSAEGIQPSSGSFLFRISR